MENPEALNVAICLPAKNELENLLVVLEEIDSILGHPLFGEVVVVVFDDGSTDDTFAKLREAHFQRFRLAVLRSLVSVGKSAGLRHAVGEALTLDPDAVITLDSDGQDDPSEIPSLLRALIDGKDVVNGRRRNREHPFLKRQSSRLFNATVRRVSGQAMWDINSGFKAYSRSAAMSLHPYFYGELHRVILVVAVWLGLDVGEVSVTNRKRLSGKTKYGPARGWRGLIDLMTIQFLRTYHARPGHFFSGFGMSLMLVGVATLIGSLITGPETIGGPVPAVVVALGLGCLALGGISMSFGFVAELIVFLSKGAPITVIRSLESHPHQGTAHSGPLIPKKPE